MTRVTLADALTGLAHEGINWVGFAESPTAARLGPVAPPRGLLLFLSLGPTFGQRTDLSRPRDNPIDARSAGLVDGFLQAWIAPHDPQASLVYPGDSSVDLRAWLQRGGLQYESPLGIGIRPDSGPWIAVRAAAWVRLPPQVRTELEAVYPPLGPPLARRSPCVDCVDSPCVQACPAGAVSRDTGLDLSRCTEHRAAPRSACAQFCFARDACPVGRPFRYPERLHRYHAARSLEAIQRWRATRDGDG